MHSTTLDRSVGKYLAMLDVCPSEGLHYGVCFQAARQEPRPALHKKGVWNLGIVVGLGIVHLL